MLLIKDANFRKYWTAVGIASLGDGISALAFPWVATLLTRDPFLIGLVAAAGRFPWLFFSLPAGVITDRVDRQTLIVRADLFRMVVTFGVVALLLSGPSLPLGDNDGAALPMILGLAGVAFLLGTAEVFRDNAAQTALPQVVEQGQLEHANGQLWSVEQIMGQFVGPPLAGFLIAVAVPLPFAFDAVTFGLAAALVWTVTMRRVTLGTEAKGFRAEFMEGARWMRGNRTILTFALMLGVLNFVTFGSLTILVLLAQEVLGLGAVGYGVILSVQAAGAVVGSLAGPWIAARIGGRATVLLALAAFAPCFALLAVTTSAVVASGALAVMMAFGMIWNIVTVSLRQRIIPAALLGRVNSIYRFFGWGAIPLGALAAGAVVALAEPSLGRAAALRLPFLVAACVVIGLFIVGYFAIRIDEGEKKDPA